MRAPSVLVALLAILAVLLTQPSLLVRCQRVRKSWKALSPTEQKAYIGAVQSAQKSGQHYRFVELHATYPNYAFAHGNCGFLMWHRKFLLAYEEMLRSQGDDYANVTIPYWNYFEDHSLHLNQNDKCRNLVECSQFLKDVGGSGGRSDQFTVVAESTSGLVKGTCAESPCSGSTRAQVPAAWPTRSASTACCEVTGRIRSSFSNLPMPISASRSRALPRTCPSSEV
ncbi:TPA: hypothetical protein N0F65_004979 [Lagenidium giganteum]|uniref:Tyrosinase copper-binding domain-containing protein n=1 Tax=Lagenidium giganteum TaxID=4803 RepID=A0AAV2ZL06_9STRA|nr:TPA: hypothetical protein N0F65_004979 [Lagenidium giganteum]